jgi:polyisoprenoid-binding protein YceI
MSDIAVHPIPRGTFRAAPTASSFAFAVRHSGAFWFRGGLTDVAAVLRAEGDDLKLEGVATVDSISIADPPAMRASVLGPEFFDAENHPAVRFASTAVRLGEDGSAAVDGELTIRGITRALACEGQWAPPRMTGFGEVAGLQLGTTIDRRDFGFDWQAELPDGGDAVGWEVEIDIDLLLIREADDDDA